MVDNVHFFLNDPGGYHDKAWILKQAQVYGNFLKETEPASETSENGFSHPQKTEWKGANGIVIQGRITKVDPVAKTVTLVRTDGRKFEGVPLGKFAPEEHEAILKSSK